MLYDTTMLIYAQGKYTVLADVISADDEKITCLTATVVFSRGGVVSYEL